MKFELMFCCESVNIIKKALKIKGLIALIGLSVALVSPSKAESIWQATAGTDGDYDFVTYTAGAGGILTPNYYKFAFKNTSKIKWVDNGDVEPGGYTWVDNGIVGSNVNVSGDTVSGVIRMKIPHNGSGTGTWNRYFIYTYTNPAGYSFVNTGTTAVATTAGGGNGSFKVVGNDNVINNPKEATIPTDSPEITHKTYVNNIVSGTIAHVNNIVGGAVITNEGTIGDVIADFIGNGTVTTGSGSGSVTTGVITNIAAVDATASTVSINSITGDFIGNYAKGLNVKGGVIYNRSKGSGLASIGAITGHFIGNTAYAPSTTAYGGVVYNTGTGTISSITGDFVGNSVNSTSKEADGGVIYNSDEGTITSINGSFIGNSAYSSSNSASGGAIFNIIKNQVVGVIHSISGDFIGNRAITASSTVSIKAQGGAIYNTGEINNITNTSFLNNYASSKGATVHGGAIYTDKSISLTADGEVSDISGNYITNDNGVSKEYEAIYVDSGSASLTFTAQNGGQFIIRDYINGVSGYEVNFNGENAGDILMNNKVVNAKVSLNHENVLDHSELVLENSSLNLQNGSVGTMALNSLTLNSNIDYMLDVNLVNKTVDTISATGAISAAANSIIISSINVISDKEGDIQITLTDNDTLKAAYTLSNTINEHVLSTNGWEYEVTYANGVLTFTGAAPLPTLSNGTIDTINQASRDYVDNVHNNYLLATTKGEHTNSVIINGTIYYFTPDETTEAKNIALVNLTYTGAQALSEVTSSDDYIFQAGSTYWTYNKRRLPLSVLEWSDGTSGNYNYASFAPDATGKYVPEYHTINLFANRMSTTDSLFFEQEGSSASEFVFNSTSETGTGVIEVNVPHNGDSENPGKRYYTYNYAVPEGYTSQSRISSLDNNVSNKYFYNRTSSSVGGAIAVASSSTGGYNITADFIQNYTTNKGGGAISNEKTLGTIIGNFIGNYASSGSGGIWGGAIRNKGNKNAGSIDAIIGDFIGNHASVTHNAADSYAHGGAISNDVVIGSITGNFIANYAHSKYTEADGGAIRNANKINSITGHFIGNYVETESSTVKATGGAIYNYNNPQTTSIHAEIDYIVGDFVDNYAESSYEVQGGAIYNEATISSIVGDFIRNSAESTGTGQGGAIYNSGTITKVVGNFIGNKANEGGAIYNTSTINVVSKNISDNEGAAAISNSGTMDLSATEADLKLYNNKNGLAYVDVYNTGTLNLNANENNAIIFGGTVSGSSGTLNLNNDANVKGGTYIFNNEVSGNSLNLYNGAKVKLGSAEQTNSTTTYGTLSLGSGSFTNSAVEGAVLDSQNIHNDYIDLGAVTLNSDLKLNLNADLANPVTAHGITYYTDTYNATSFNGTGSFIINSLLIDTDPSTTEFETRVGNSVLIDHMALAVGFEPTISGGASGNYLVTLQNKADDGVYFRFVHSTLTNLVDSVRQDGSVIMYTLSADENIADDLEALGLTDDKIGTQAGTQLTIHGENYDVNGASKAGMTVGSGKTLFVENVGSLSGDVITKSWHGFSSENGGVINNNGGTVTITDSVFSNNTATGNGGAIYNTGTLNLSGTNTFSNNTANSAANDVYNTGTINFAADSTTNIKSGINGSSGTITMASGSVLNADGTINNNAVSMSNSTINILENGSLTTTSLTTNTDGSVIDSRNNKLDYINFGALTLNNDLNIKLDADLAHPVNRNSVDYYSDTYYATSFTGTGGLVINNVLINSDANDNTIETKVGNDVLINHISLAAGFEPDYAAGILKSYVVSLDNKADDGVYFYFEDSSKINLVHATRINKSEVQYNVQSDENITTDLAILELTDGKVGTQASPTLSVIGNGYNINGDANEGITVNTGKVLNVSNIGIDALGTQTGNGFYGFSATNGSVINNAGTVNLTDTIFANNTATTNGGAIYNTGTLNLSGTNTFNNNTANSVANDVYNIGTINLATDSITDINSGISGSNGTITMASGSVLNTDGTINNNSVTTNGGAINLSENGLLTLNSLTSTNGSSLVNTANGSIEANTFGALTLTDALNLAIDINLTGSTADTFAVNSLSGSSSIIISAINLIAGTGSDEINIALTDDEDLFGVYSLSGSILSNITRAIGVTYTVDNVSYDNTTGILTFNKAPAVISSETISSVKTKSTEYLELGQGNHSTYTDLVTSKNVLHPDVVVINGTIYYYKANENTLSLTQNLRNLASTGAVALTEVSSSEDYIFSVNDKYYTYSAAKLPNSAWQQENATANDYDYTMKKGSEQSYYNVDLKNNAKITWTATSSAGGAPVWDDENKQATGTIGFEMPHTSGSTTTGEMRYYTYVYTLPAGYSETSTRYEQTSGTGEESEVSNKLFLGIVSSASEQGGAILLKVSVDNIKSDFIGNQTSHKFGGGALALSGTGNYKNIEGLFIGNSALKENGGGLNGGTTGKIAQITGLFIANSAAGQGGAIYRKGSTGAITADFIGNSAGFIGESNLEKQGGAIYQNVGTKIGTIVGDFIANKAAADGGAIYTLGESSKTTEIGGIFGSFINNSAGSRGGALYLSEYVDYTVSADFTGNTAGSQGGAIYNAGTLNLNASARDIIFYNNKAGDTYNDIYNTNTINLNADAISSIVFNGTINGSGGIIKINNDADIKGGKYVFNNVISGNSMNLYRGAKVTLGSVTQEDGNPTYGQLDISVLTTDNNIDTTLDTKNDHIEENNIGTLTLGADLNLKLDVQLSDIGSAADTFVINASGAGNQKLVLDTTDFINQINNLSENKTIKLQIIKGLNDDTQLTWSGAKDESQAQGVVAIMNSDMIVGSDYYLAKTDTTHDSIIFRSSADAFRSWAELETDENKKFTFNSSDKYTLDENTNLEGKNISIVGAANELDLDNKTLLSTVQSTQNITFENITVENSLDIANNGKLTFENATIDSKITNNAGSELTINANNSKTITFTGDIVGTNYTLTFTGDNTGRIELNNEITADNAELETVTLKLGNTDALKNAIITVTSGTINVADGAYKNYNIGKLTSTDTARYNIDLDILNERSDTFTIGTGSTGTIYLASITVDPEAVPDDELRTVQIIHAAGGTGPELSYNNAQILHVAVPVMSSGNILAKEFGLWTTTTTNDSIRASGLQDPFKAWTTLETDEHKQYTFTQTADYTIINSISLDGNDNAEIINNGTVTNNGTLSNMTLTNTGTFTTNANKIAPTNQTVTNDGILNLTGGTNANKVVNTDESKGTVNFSDVTSNSAQIVANSITNTTTGDNILTNTGDVEATATFTNSGKWTNSGNGKITATDIENSDTGVLTSAVEKLDGNIENRGNLYLSGALDKNITGNGTTYVNSALTLNSGAGLAGTLNANTGTITVSQGSMTSHNIGTINGNGNLVIDFNATAGTADLLTTSAQSSGTLTLTNLTLTGDFTNINENYKVQILKNENGNSTLKLALSEAVKTALGGDTVHEVFDEAAARADEVDEVQATTSWSDKLYNWHHIDTIKHYGIIGLTTTTTTKDSIGYIQDHTERVPGERVNDAPLGDTLMLVNQDTENPTKDFTAGSQGATYNATANVGTTNGTVNINGVEGGATETVNLGGYSGFELSTETSVLTLNNVTIGGSDTIATISDTGAIIGLTNAIVNGAINGSSLGSGNTFVMTTAGTSTLNGVVSNAAITNSGSLTTTAENIANSSLTNNSNLYLSGELGKNIAGNGGTTYVNTSLTLNAGAGISGTLNANSGTITVSQGSLTNHNIGTLGGTGNLAIDINSLTQESDSFTISNNAGTSGTLTVTAINLLGGQSVEDTSDFTVKVLNGGNANLDISNSLITAYYKHDVSQRDEEVTANVSWDKIFHVQERTVDRNLSKVQSVAESIYDTIKLETTDTGWVDTETKVGDTLMLVNQDTTNPTKTFTAASDGATYNVGDDLGTTNGTVNVNGVAGGDAETVDLKGYNGFELSTATSILNLSNITVDDSTKETANTTIATVSNGGATIGLTNVIVNGAINGSSLGSGNTFTLTTAGTSALNGAVSNAAITNSGTLSGNLANLTNSTLTNNGTFNMGGNLTQDILGTSGTTVLQSDSVVIDANRSIAGTLDVNGKTLAMQDSNYETLSVGKLTSNGNIEIDVDASSVGGNADKINITGEAQNSSVLTITTLNMLTPLTIDGDSYTYQKQIITGHTSGATLEFGDGVTTPYNTTSEISRSGTEELATNEILWNANYGGWEETGTETREVSIVDSSNSSVQDSIKYTINKDWNGRQYTEKSENLAIMNTYTGTGSSDRSVDFTGIFNAPTSGTYTVASDLGTSSAGTYTLGGVKGGSGGTTNTTIDLNNHNSFVLSNATTLNLTNIDIKDSTKTSPNTTIATVSNTSAAIGLTNTTLEGNIAANVAYGLTLSGENTINGTVGKANATMSSGTLVFNTDTFANANSVSFTGGTINLKDSAINTYTINNLTSGNGASYSLDLDVTAGTSDVINGTGTSSGKVKVGELQLLNDLTALDKTFKVQLAQGGISLELSNDVISQLDGKEYSLGQEDEARYYDAIAADTAWDHEYQSHVDTMNLFGKLGLATTTTENDSIGVSESRRTKDHTTDESMGDTLKLVNVADNNAAKDFTAGSDGDTYNVSEDLGATYGTVNINGVAGGDAETINLNGKSGFELSTATSKLNLNNVTVGGSDTIATVSDENATISLNNATVNGGINSTTSFALTTAGTSELNGTVNNANIANTGNLTTNNSEISGSITNTGTINLANSSVNGNIVNDGTVNLNGGAVNGELSSTSDTGIININSDWTVENTVKGNTVNVNDSTLKVGENHLDNTDSLNAKHAVVDIGSNTVNVKNVTLDASSTLVLKINGLEDGQHGLLDVANTITINKGAKLKATLGQGATLGEVTLLRAPNHVGDFADDDVSHTEEGVEIADNNMYRFVKSKDKFGVYKITQKATAEEVVKGENARPWVADAAKAWVDSDAFAEGSRSAKIADKLSDLAQNNALGLVRALKALAPTETAVIHNTVTEQSSRLFKTIDAYLRGERDAMGLSSGDELKDVSVWIKTYFGNSKVDKRKNISGSDTDSKGVILGIERKIDNTLKIGGGLQIDKTDVDALSRDMDINSAMGFVYGEYKPSEWFINGIGSYGQSDYKEEKHAFGNTYTARYNVHMVSVAGMAGYQFKYFTPEAGLRYYHIKQDEYRDGADQKVGAANTDILRAVAGVRFTKKIYNIQSDAYVGLTYDVITARNDTQVNLTNGASYTVSGKRLHRLGYEANASIGTDITDHLSASISYMGAYRSGYQEHTGMLNLKYKF